MKLKLLFVALLFFCGVSYAAEPFKGKFYDSADSIFLHVDLYQESVEVPGYEMLGLLNGYLKGNIFGVWMITSFEMESENCALIRLSNDFGSETQSARLSILAEGSCLLELCNGVVIKKVVGKKLVKIPRKLTFVSKDD